MKFNDEDIRAVAKSRVVRTEGNKPNYWLGGALAVLLLGLYLYRTNTTYGIVVMGLALVGYFWYARKLGQKQREASINLVKEYHDEETK